MELSQFVIKEIAALDHYSSRRYYDASLSLKNAVCEAKNEQDKRILNALSGMLSMSFDRSKQKFLPMIVLVDGSRSFAMEDILPEDIVIIEEIVDNIKTAWAKAKLAHILWFEHPMKKYEYGKIAVLSYIELFYQTLDKEDWSECYDSIDIASSIASMYGKTSELSKQVYKVVMQAITEINGSDPLFLSLCLIRLIYKEASLKDLENICLIAEKLANKNISKSNDNFDLAEETHIVLKCILERLKKSDNIKSEKIRIAEYFAEYAIELSNNGDDLRAIMLLKKACTFYNGVNKQRLIELRETLKTLQQRSITKMASIPWSFDATATNKRVEQLFSQLTVQEAIVQIGRLAKFYNVDDVKKKLIDDNRKSIFKFLFGSSHLNEKGQMICDLPALSIDNPESDQELLFKHMVHYVAQNRDYESLIVLRKAIECIHNIGITSENELDFLIDNNPIIPEGRAFIIKEGIFLGLSGNLYTAMHILLPQTEHIFRNLVKMCGDTITFLNPDGTETYKLLSQLFKSEKLHECYSEDIIFTFQSIMDVPIGENLRNMIAHGLFEPHQGNDIKSLYFLCLLIKLLSWYSLDAKPIFKSLSERDLIKE